jgi:hypothetical protein
MITNSKLKYFEKIVKNRNGSIIAKKNDTIALLNTGTTAVCFHKDGKDPLVTLRLKI